MVRRGEPHLEDADANLAGPQILGGRALDQLDGSAVGEYGESLHLASGGGFLGAAAGRRLVLRPHYRATPMFGGVKYSPYSDCWFYMIPARGPAMDSLA